LSEILEAFQKELVGHCQKPDDVPQKEAKETVLPLDPISSNFEMKIKTLIVCQECENEIQNESVHRGISLDILNFDG